MRRPFGIDHFIYTRVIDHMRRLDETKRHAKALNPGRTSDWQSTVVGAGRDLACQTWKVVNFLSGHRILVSAGFADAGFCPYYEIEIWLHFYISVYFTRVFFFVCRLPSPLFRPVYVEQETHARYTLQISSVASPRPRQPYAGLLPPQKKG